MITAVLTRCSAFLIALSLWMLGPGPAAAQDGRRIFPNLVIPKLDLPINITLSAVLQMNPKRGYEYASPLQLYRVAQDFPKLDIHVAHAGWPAVMDMIGVAFVCPNVWVSPDMYLFLPGWQMYVEAANGYLQDRFLFGTAYPALPFAETVERFLKLPFSEQVIERVLYGNAARLLALAE